MSFRGCPAQVNPLLFAANDAHLLTPSADISLAAPLQPRMPIVTSSRSVLPDSGFQEINLSPSRHLDSDPAAAQFAVSEPDAAPPHRQLDSSEQLSVHSAPVASVSSQQQQQTSSLNRSTAIFSSVFNALAGAVASTPFTISGTVLKQESAPVSATVTPNEAIPNSSAFMSTNSSNVDHPVFSTTPTFPPVNTTSTSVVIQSSFPDGSPPSNVCHNSSLASVTSPVPIEATVTPSVAVSISTSSCLQDARHRQSSLAHPVDSSSQLLVGIDHHSLPTSTSSPDKTCDIVETTHNQDNVSERLDPPLAVGLFTDPVSPSSESLFPACSINSAQSNLLHFPTTITSAFHLAQTSIPSTAGTASYTTVPHSFPSVSVSLPNPKSTTAVYSTITSTVSLSYQSSSTTVVCSISAPISSFGTSSSVLTPKSNISPVPIFTPSYFSTVQNSKPSSSFMPPTPSSVTTSDPRPTSSSSTSHPPIYPLMSHFAAPSSVNLQPVRTLPSEFSRSTSGDSTLVPAVTPAATVFVPAAVSAATVSVPAAAPAATVLVPAAAPAATVLVPAAAPAATVLVPAAVPAATVLVPGAASAATADYANAPSTPPQCFPAAASLGPPPKEMAAGSLRRSTLRYRYAQLPGLSVTRGRSQQPPPPGPNPSATTLFHPQQSAAQHQCSDHSAVLMSPTLGGPPPAAAPPPCPSSGEPSCTMPYSDVPNHFSPQQMSPLAPPSFHWFYCTSQPHTVNIDESWPSGPQLSAEELWHPFSERDNTTLESAWQSPSQAAGVVVVLGGRYEADVVGRQLRSVYWQSEPLTISRCCWFSRGAHESKYIPYTEREAELLEDLYVRSVRSGKWHGSVTLGDCQGYVILHSSTVFVHHPGVTAAFETVALPDDPSRPRHVRRGWNTVELATVPADEADHINHLVFLVHGIGPVCDLRRRPLNECVDEMRRMAAQLVEAHFGAATRAGRLGRVELMPVSWHEALHGAATGLDASLQPITLASIPLLRDFVNSTVLDVLSYTSPVYCQVIIDAVVNNMNRVYGEFCRRNPHFGGSVSLVGHSLGSVILYDLLSHQPQPQQLPQQLPKRHVFSNELGNKREEYENSGGGPDSSCITSSSSCASSASSATTIGTAGTGRSSVIYPALHFQPACLFGLGSPIALFARVNGRCPLTPHSRLPTCRRLFNIFHPFDPVAYRIEPLVEAAMAHQPPVLIPHHKGRKRMHLEIRDQVARVGSDLKQLLVNSLQTTIHGLRRMAGTDNHNQAPAPATAAAAAAAAPNNNSSSSSSDVGGGGGGCDQSASSSGANGQTNDSINVGCLNGGRRIDYVLQEKPFESLNEYVFAVQSHLCYWDSEDTLLMIIKEILAEDGILCDAESVQCSESASASTTTAAASATAVTAAASATTAAASVTAAAASATAAASASAAVGKSSSVQPSQPLAAAVPLFAGDSAPAPVAAAVATPVPLVSASLAPATPPVPVSLPAAAEAVSSDCPPQVVAPVPLLPACQPAVALPTVPDGRLCSRRPRHVLPDASAVGMDPTVPSQAPTTIAPPPMSGFRRI